MYRIDVFIPRPRKGGNKKISSHWYPTYEQARNAGYAIARLHGRRTIVPGENRKPKTLNFTGYIVSMPVEDNKY